VAANPPYLLSPGTLTKALEKIKVAATPPRFTQDFLNTKLKMKGGSANALIPFLKRVGFISTEGTPTSLYEQFRNPTQSGMAIAQALRRGYQGFYEVNEYVHDLSDEELKGLIVQVTGLERTDRVTSAIFGTFTALKVLASFDAPGTTERKAEAKERTLDREPTPGSLVSTGLSLSYTINLNLPATTNVEVFNAIFKSLKENLLKDE